MNKYSIGTKGSRNMKRWKPETKFKWVMYRSKFLKVYGMLLSNWWSCSLDNYKQTNP